VKSIDSNPVDKRLANSVTFSTLDTRSLMARIQSQTSYPIQLIPLPSEKGLRYTISDSTGTPLPLGWKQRLYIINYYLHLENSSLLDIQQTEKRVGKNCPVFVAQISSPSPIQETSGDRIKKDGLCFTNIVQINPTEWRVWFYLDDSVGTMFCTVCGDQLWYNQVDNFLYCESCEYQTPSFTHHYNEVCPYYIDKEMETLLQLLE